MIKKVAAATAVLSLTATVLVGCASGKLNTQDTCDYVNEQVAIKQLLQKSEDVSEDLIAGDMKGYSLVIDEYSGILNDAAEKTKDKKLAKALHATAEQSNQVSAVMAEGTSSNVAQTDQKLTALEDQAASEETEYLGIKCPELESFS
ncbi:hypothetical protein [Arthrobacter sp. S41]|uniref:hypothetical protein n=1 Tax=Arthrobacter sp. S41 TaxID=2509721 RepID=UPI0010365E22|nr:hypothetical protein [Arthrobacter sp. S41]TAP27864.1 hypothetical protein EYR88_05950 [Arthrobacter sp. S41]